MCHKLYVSELNVSELKRSRVGWNPRVELVGVEWSPYLMVKLVGLSFEYLIKS
jgi:hypothetical protein